MAIGRKCLLLMAVVQIGLCVPEPDPDPHNVVIQVKQEVNSGCCNGGCPPEPEKEHVNCNVDCEHWCYPSRAWPSTCSNLTSIHGFCDGQKQSPIDIDSRSATNTSGSLTFSSTYYDPIDKLTIENNGHTVHASWNSSHPPRTISGGGLSGNYTLAQFHFHWGCENNRGSEHVVDHTRYAMELHFVHYKTSYDNMTNAIKYSDGLAVLGVFFNVGSATNNYIKPITNKLPTVVSYGAVNNIPFGKALVNLIPTTRTFYRYQGSLTTPTCNEVVIWSVFSTHLTLSNEQVEAFRDLKDTAGRKLYDNYRSTQPLHGRVVTKYI